MATLGLVDNGRPSCELRSRVAANHCDQGAAGEVQKYTDDPAVADCTAMDRAEALAAAADCLERALRHERWGCSAQDYAAQAVPFLRAAGRGDLADRLEDDAWGGDTGAVLAEVTKARMRDGNP